MSHLSCQVGLHGQPALCPCLSLTIFPCPLNSPPPREARTCISSCTARGSSHPATRRCTASNSAAPATRPRRTRSSGPHAAAAAAAAWPWPLAPAPAGLLMLMPYLVGAPSINDMSSVHTHRRLRVRCGQSTRQFSVTVCCAVPGAQLLQCVGLNLLLVALRQLRLLHPRQHHGVQQPQAAGGRRLPAQRQGLLEGRGGHVGLSGTGALIRGRWGSCAALPCPDPHPVPARHLLPGVSAPRCASRLSLLARCSCYASYFSALLSQHMLTPPRHPPA